MHVANKLSFVNCRYDLENSTSTTIISTSTNQIIYFCLQAECQFGEFSYI